MCLAHYITIEAFLQCGTLSPHTQVIICCLDDCAKAMILMKTREMIIQSRLYLPQCGLCTAVGKLSTQKHLEDD